MTLLSRVHFLILLLPVIAAGCAGPRSADSDVVARSTRGTFDDVKERLVFALENRGLTLAGLISRPPTAGSAVPPAPSSSLDLRA